MTANESSGPPDEDEEFGPGDPDFDLSEAHGYTWEDRRRPTFPPWAVAAVSILLVVALLLPALIVISRR